MKNLLFPLFCLLIVVHADAQSNIFPSSGNVGIGTTSPVGDLDVYNKYYTHGYKFMDNVLSNASVGFLNPIAMALQKGKKLFPDEEFVRGLNNIHVYDNHHTNQVTITRTHAISDLPNNSGYGLIITHSGNDELPGLGGFYQSFQSGMNKTIVQIFRAKLPAGYQFGAKSNSIGSGGKNYWLSNKKGTGKWEWYIRVTQCGNGGSFSSSGHVYVTGSPAPTSTSPLVWYIASYTAFDITNLNDDNGNFIVNQKIVDQKASMRISGNGIFGGNVGIGTATPQSKLAVNGTITAQKIQVTQAGWPDYVFDTAYTLRSIDSLEKFIKVHKHFPDMPSARAIAEKGNDLAKTDALLLKKIEELTLYQISSHKEIQRLKRELGTDKAELSALKKEIIQLKYGLKYGHTGGLH